MVSVTLGFLIIYFLHNFSIEIIEIKQFWKKLINLFVFVYLTIINILYLWKIFIKKKKIIEIANFKLILFVKYFSGHFDAPRYNINHNSM